MPYISDLLNESTLDLRFCIPAAFPMVIVRMTTSIRKGQNLVFPPSHKSVRFLGNGAEIPPELKLDSDDPDLHISISVSSVSAHRLVPSARDITIFTNTLQSPEQYPSYRDTISYDWLPRRRFHIS